MKAQVALFLFFGLVMLAVVGFLYAVISAASINEVQTENVADGNRHVDNVATYFQECLRVAADQALAEIIPSSGYIQGGQLDALTVEYTLADGTVLDVPVFIEDYNIPAPHYPYFTDTFEYTPPLGIGLMDYPYYSYFQNVPFRIANNSLSPRQIIFPTCELGFANTLLSLPQFRSACAETGSPSIQKVASDLTTEYVGYCLEQNKDELQPKINADVDVVLDLYQSSNPKVIMLIGEDSVAFGFEFATKIEAQNILFELNTLSLEVPYRLKKIQSLLKKLLEKERDDALFDITSIADKRSLGCEECLDNDFFIQSHGTVSATRNGELRDFLIYSIVDDQALFRGFEDTSYFAIMKRRPFLDRIENKTLRLGEELQISPDTVHNLNNKQIVIDPNKAGEQESLLGVEYLSGNGGIVSGLLDGAWYATGIGSPVEAEKSRLSANYITNECDLGLIGTHEINVTANYKVDGSPVVGDWQPVEVEILPPLDASSCLAYVACQEWGDPLFDELTFINDCIGSSVCASSADLNCARDFYESHFLDASDLPVADPCVTLNDAGAESIIYDALSC